MLLEFANWLNTKSYFEQKRILIKFAEVFKIPLTQKVVKVDKIQKLYEYLPIKERNELKYNICGSYLYQNLMRLNSALREENIRLKKENNQLKNHNTELIQRLLKYEH